nr:RES domain-containing protein [Tomitella cavernea]
MYAGSTEQGALLEVLSYIEPDQTSPITMSDVFDDVTADDDLFLHEQIANELPAHGGMAARSVSKHWREIRAIYEFELPTVGWFVDVTASDSIGAFDKQLRSTLADEHGIDELQLSHLTADGAAARLLTTAVAGWVRGQVLDDGSLAHGIVYPSKFGRDIENYAMWLRRRDDGTSDDIDPRSTRQNAIGRHADAFQRAVERLRLRAH